MERTHVCAICKAPLVTLWDAKGDSDLVACGQDHHHEGFERVMSYTQMRKAGMQLPMEIEEQFQRKEEGIMREQETEKETTISALVPLNDAGSGTALAVVQRQLIVDVAQEMRLNPRMGHVVLYYGRPYVTESGMLYYAHRTGKFDGIRSRPLNKAEREEYQIAEGEHAWIAEVYRTDTSMPFTGIGRAREDPLHPIARKSAVEPEHPQRMAEKRAEMQGMHKAFPLGLPLLGEEESDERQSP
jgi:hypothetical protein